jgi:GNAT superfamily N-acetyltransferase
MNASHNHPNAVIHLSADKGFFSLTLQDSGMQLGIVEGYLAPHWVSVQRVEVPAEFRRQGIATRLMRHLEEHAAALGCNVCHVQLFSGFDTQGFFEAIGYSAMPADMSSQGDVARVYMDRQLRQEQPLMAA